ncbi:EG45-like domain containing protein 2 [Mangifera indica]|uniref:EG45-like domain containing protein 2 n=1 Tax=Mangifera indica TaxID=29780 RepID=UPI001CF9A12C|nr:EG45-like domain containing protein 2 [Mangifera indica]
MAIQMQIFMILGMILCLTSVAHAAQGNAVFYNPPYTPSACYQNQDHGSMVTGVSDALWEDGAACGRNYTVRCIGAANEAPHPCHDGASVEVTAVDYCEEICNGVLNLSQDAFALIADLDAGKVQVEYDQA